MFTTSGAGENWKLYGEKAAAAEKWFISYQEAHFESDHGVPMWWNAKPDIYVGVLKQNVFIEVSYSALPFTSSSNYIQTINKDIRFAADLLSKAPHHTTDSFEINGAVIRKVVPSSSPY